MAQGAEARKRTRLDSDERRASIFSAACRLFTSRPYSEVSMGDVAEAAGVARGLLHHYFGSKRDLYLEVVRALSRLPSLPVPGDADATAATWEAGVDLWLGAIEANRELWLTAIGAGATGRDPDVESILDEARELVAGRVLQALGLDAGPVPDELRALVRGYGGLAEEVTREWLERGRLTREQARVVLVTTMPLLVEQVLPLLPPAPAHRNRPRAPGGRAAASRRAPRRRG